MIGPDPFLSSALSTPSFSKDSVSDRLFCLSGKPARKMVQIVPGVTSAWVFRVTTDTEMAKVRTMQTVDCLHAVMGPGAKGRVLGRLYHLETLSKLLICPWSITARLGLHPPFPYVPYSSQPASFPLLIYNNNDGVNQQTTSHTEIHTSSYS
jgi:hypothetical protein